MTKFTENRDYLDLIPEALLVIHFHPFEIKTNKAFKNFSNLATLLDEIYHSSDSFSILNKLGLYINEHEQQEIIVRKCSITKQFLHVTTGKDTSDLECTINPLLNGITENVHGLFIILKDISTRKACLDTLKEQSHFIQSMADALPIPFIYKNKSGAYLFVNKAFEDFSMKSRDEIIGKTVFDIYPDRLAKRYTEADEHTFRINRPYTYETILPHQDGTNHNVVISKTVYKDLHHKIKGSFGALLDFTKLRKTQLSFSHHLNFEKILLEISSSFINIPPEAVDNYIEVSLRIITDFLGINSIFFYRDLEEENYQLTHKYYRNENHNPHIDLVDFLPEKIPFLINQMKENQIINNHKPGSLPDDAINERALMAKYSYQLLVSVPIAFHSKISGLICLFANENSREFTVDDLHLIHFIGEIFFMAIERQKYNAQLIFRDKTMQTVIDIQEKFYRSDAWHENIRFMLKKSCNLLHSDYSFIAQFHQVREKSKLKIISGYKSGVSFNDILTPEEEYDGLFNDLHIIERHLNSKKLYSKFKNSSAVIKSSRERNRKSLIHILIPKRDTKFGILGLERDIQKYPDWSDAEIELLLILSSIIGPSVEKKDTLKELIASEEKFRNIFKSTSDPVMILDLRGNILLANDNFNNRFREAGKNTPVRTIFDVIQKETHLDIRKRFQLLRMQKELDVFEYRYDLGDNKKGILEINSKAIVFNNKRAIISVLRDITERKTQERKLLDAIIQTEERERQRFASDLHDDLGPLLSGIKLYLNEISTTSLSNQKRLELVKYLEEIVDDAIGKTRLISGKLMPNVLIDYGLESAVKSFILKINKVYSGKINFYTSGLEKRINPSLEIIIYRIITELLNNSIKHANPSNILINIFDKKNFVNLIYQDDGIGFSLRKKLSMPEGHGLLSMINRLASVYGSYEFSSRKNKGARFEINIPKEK